MKLQELVLIVEDDEAISKLLDMAFTQNGYKTLIAKNLKSAVRELKTNSPDAVILDLGLPDGDGKELIKTIRTHLSVPIIILSARHEEKEIILSLDLGADDYVTKPFSTHELLARVRSTQRRFLGINPGSALIQCGELSIDLEHLVFAKNNGVLKLTPTEFSIMKYFMTHSNQVITHSKLLKEVWGVGYQNEMQYLRTYINSLRKKIENDTTRPIYILTELGIGYRFYCPGSVTN